MQTIFFTTDERLLEEWIAKHNAKNPLSFYELEKLQEQLEKSPDSLVIADYDSVAQDVNQMIAKKSLPKNIIVLEKKPEVITGKMLITHGVKAYGNTRMLQMHYTKMIESVSQGKVWTYPELTALLAGSITDTLSKEAQELIEHRLTEKEKEVVMFVLEGLTNEAIANELDITQRTVKAHMSSIFSKLHVNDRLALVLLLK